MRSGHSRAGRTVLALTLVLGATAFAGPPARAGAWAPHRVVVGYDVPAAQVAAPWSTAGSAAASRPVRSRVDLLPQGESVRSALRRLRRRPGVRYAEPDYIARQAGMFYPDDPGVAQIAQGWERQQWNFLPGTGVNAPEAWANLIADRRSGGRGVTVAVLDTGVAYRNWHQFHVSPDLRQTRFVAPYDFVAHNRYPLDREGHGTLVASMIAEATNNGIGLAGLAYGASIMPVRVLNSSGLGDESTIAQAIRYAVTHGANIINLSLEFPPDQVRTAAQIPLIVSAVHFARAHGVMVVAAAGNDETDRVAYPARLAGIVAVGATTKDGCLASYSNSGDGIALVAPGGGTDAILRDDPACHPERTLPPIFQMTLTDPPEWSRFGYPDYYIGTSMASPEVAAAAALVIASHVIGVHPTPDQVLRRLEQTATTLPAGGHAPNPTYGYGLLDAGAATAPIAVTAR